MATLTITTTSEQDARIVRAFGYAMDKEDEDGNHVDATGAEVRAHVIDFIRNTVLFYERMEKKREAVKGVADLNI